MAKLDPANWKSAKDVYDERSAEAAKKRKRGGNEESLNAVTDQTVDESVEQPQPSKKQKANDSTAKPVIVGKVGDLETPDQIANKNLKKKMKKRAHRLEKNQEIRSQKEQRKAERAAQRDTATETAATEPPKKQEKSSQKSASKKDHPRKLDPTPAKVKNTKSQSSKKDVNETRENVQATRTSKTAAENSNGTDVSGGEEEDAWSDVDEEMSGFDKLGALQDDEDEVMEDASSITSSSEDVPEILSPPQDSAASSVSSILPPTTVQPSATTQQEEKVAKASKQTDAPPQTIQSEAERAAARQRLQEQISQFRSQRKADDRPVRSRAELLEQRRRTEAERKEAKKEQRKKQKEEEARLQDEEMARRFSPGGSGSLLASPRSPIVDAGGNESFTFGRIAFEDGTQLDPKTLSAIANKKQKGASDPATALKAAQAKSARIAGLDETKKQDIEEKDMWLNAKKRAHGERVKDDTSLLKKALKRQEKEKQRSEKDWNKRVEGVQMSQFAKQKRRTENLQKRKDEKGSKKSGKSGKSGKKVKRPGFEGSLKSRTGKSKQK